MRLILFIMLLFLAEAPANTLLAYYQQALEHTGLSTQYLQQSRSATAQVDGATYNRYSTFSLGAQYSRTKAKTLSSGFNISNVAIDDTIDLFGKNKNSVTALKAQNSATLAQINATKQQLFQGVVDLVVGFEKNSKLLALHQAFYDKQQQILQELKKGVKLGSFARLDANRFENALVLLRNQIMTEEQQIKQAQSQLDLMVPGGSIPTLKMQTFLYSEAMFLAHDPRYKAETSFIEAQAQTAEVIAKQWRPELTLGASFERNDDPTGYGDNYAVRAGMRFVLGSGLASEKEAANRQVLALKSKQQQLQIALKQQYAQLRIALETAATQLAAIESSQALAKQSAQSAKAAYLKHYIDFNTYLQTMQQLLMLQETRLSLYYSIVRNGTLLQHYCEGKIYE